MVARILNIIKKPRETPILDKPINFPSLINLHLELIENKKKLKKNLPPVIETPFKPKEKINEGQKSDVPKGQGTEKSDVPKGQGTEKAKEKVKEKTETAKGVESKAKGVESKAKGVESKAKPKEKAEEKAEAESKPENNTEEDEDLVKNLGNDDGTEKNEDDKIEPEGKAEPETNGKTDPETEGKADGEADEKEEANEEENDPYAGLTPEEREAKEKEEYIWRFRILKKQYKKVKIPEYNEHDDLGIMKTVYNRTVKDLHLESSVESYRQYLVSGFMIMEYGCINFIGIDLAGFTTQQMTLMDQYEKLLIELGEKSRNRWGLNLPVEIKLIGFILLQAGIFYIGKIISEKGNTSITQIYSMLSGQDIGSLNIETEKPKKMRGPSIKREDILNISKRTSKNEGETEIEETEIEEIDEDEAETDIEEKNLIKKKTLKHRKSNIEKE